MNDLLPSREVTTPVRSRAPRGFADPAYVGAALSSPIRFMVPINPVGKGRPRFGNGRAYTPARTRKAEADIAIMAKSAMRGRQALAGPVVLDVRAFFPIPPSWPKWKRDSAATQRIFPTGPIDADNILKLVGDALNGIVFVDDAQVVSAAVHKDYGSPRLEIEVCAIQTEEILR
jgi:Holliday junction resolvase RusA-like endonuclease